MRKLSWRIKKKTVAQYLLIYLAICLNDSFIYYQIIDRFIYVFVALGAALIAIHRRLQNKWTFTAAIGLLVLVVAQRFISGGVGLGLYLTWMVHILFGSIAVLYDREHFMNRYVRVIAFLAGVSLVYFGISIVNVDFARRLTLIHLPYQTSNSRQITIDGLFLYSFNPWHYDRNTGIFGEPGLYQIVLNSALFFLLFFERYCRLSRKKVIRYAAIIAAALITTRSTTGFIGLLIIVGGYLLAGRKGKSISLRRGIIIGLIVVALALLLDYQYNLTNSVIQTAVLSKLFASDGTLDLLNSSGRYRFGTMEISAQSFIAHPFGVGYDRVAELLSARNGLVAAKFMTTAAACGIQWTVFTLVWLFWPIVKSRWAVVTKIVFALLYFNTALAQSQEFYAAFIVAIYFAIAMRGAGRRRRAG